MTCLPVLPDDHTAARWSLDHDLQPGPDLGRDRRTTFAAKTPAGSAPQADYSNGAGRPSPRKKEQATPPRDTPNGRAGARENLSSATGRAWRQSAVRVWYLG